jgi:hypothetical protein
MYKPEPQENPAKKPAHPVWRGVGCGLMIVIPVLSYIAGSYFVSNADGFQWMVIPQEMVIRWKDPLLLVKLLYAAIFAAGLYLLLSVITFFVNRFFGAPRFGPQDIPLDQVDIKYKKK